MNVNGCLFCGISGGEIPSEKIYENESVFAFLDIKPLSLGHTLIIPKDHSENILGLPDSAVEGLFLAVKHVTGMLEVALRPLGFTIGINHGKISGQAVDHLHIHVIPRYKGDNGGGLHSVVNSPPNEEIGVTRKRIIEKN